MSLYHLIIQVFVQSCAGREALSIESARFRTAKDERPSPVAGLFFRNHTLARHRPNRGPTTNITKALHQAIRIHHLRTLGHSIGVRSDTNSDIAKKNASDLCLSRVGSPRCFRNRPALLPLPKRLVQFKGGGVRRGQRALSEYMAKGHRRRAQAGDGRFDPGREEHALRSSRLLPKILSRSSHNTDHIVRSMRIILPAIGVTLNRKVFLGIIE